MKIIYFFALLLLTNLLHSADIESSAADEFWRQQIKGNLELYRDYIPVQYVCVCVKFAHIILGSETRQDELKKLEQTSILLANLNNSKWGINDTLAFLGDMEPFVDDYGKKFKVVCNGLLQNHRRGIQHKNWHKDASRIKPELSTNALIDEEQSTRTCYICLDKESFEYFLPCGHLAPCRWCSLRTSRPHECPKCRGAVEEERVLYKNLTQCVRCKKNLANMVFTECRHVILCEECRDDHCYDCRRDRFKKNKLYLDN